MIDFSYETQGNNSFLVYELSENDVIDSTSLGMITTNKIPGIAQTIYTQLNMQKYLKYNISSKVSVKQMFDDTINKKRLLGIFSGIVDALQSAEEYMLDEKSIIIDLNYIYADVTSCETMLICLPLQTLDVERIDLGKFFKDIMCSLKTDPSENVEYFGKILNYLNSNPIFSLDDFGKLIKDLKNDDTNIIIKKTQENKTNTVPSSNNGQKKEKVIQPEIKKELPKINKESEKKELPPEPPIEEKQTSDEKHMSVFYLLQHYNKENAAIYKAQKAKKSGKKTTSTAERQEKNYKVPGAPDAETPYPVPGMESKTTVESKSNEPQPKNDNIEKSYTPPQNDKKVPSGESMDFGNTTVLNKSKIGETTVLNKNEGSKSEYPYLIRQKTNKRIDINKPNFRIGKEKSFVDYFISDNSAISRSHANIITREGKYFVIDTNSTNHTYLNGSMIQSNIEVELQHDDKIRFANEDFDFKLY